MKPNDLFLAADSLHVVLQLRDRLVVALAEFLCARGDDRFIPALWLDPDDEHDRECIALLRAGVGLPFGMRLDETVPGSLFAEPDDDVVNGEMVRTPASEALHRASWVVADAIDLAHTGGLSVNAANPADAGGGRPSKP
jgi:hypothetical protein